MYSLYDLKHLIDLLNNNGRNWDILKMWNWTYCICDMNDNPKMIKFGTRAYLIWFCEWLLFDN